MTATDHALELVRVAAAAASDKLGENILAFDVSDQLAITDVFLLVSGSNDRQVNAIVDAVEEKLRDLDVRPLRREGQREGRWVLLDYGDIVVHVQHEEERRFYALERLWRDCPVIALPGIEPPGAIPADPADDDPRRIDVPGFEDFSEVGTIEDEIPDNGISDDGVPGDEEPDDGELA